MIIEAATGSKFLHVVISLSVLLFAAKIFAVLFARIELPIVCPDIFFLVVISGASMNPARSLAL
jgi:hypothetical protein